MRTEEILVQMERQSRRRKWRRLRWRILREILRGGVCLIGGATIVCIGVPVMELLLESWGSRVWVELGVSYAGILWLVDKAYGLEGKENEKRSERN